MIKVKRIYDPADPSDGLRVLVDRLWPRGVPTKKARIDEWCKDLAPSDALRRWFGHDPRKWTEFKRRNHEELKTKQKEIKSLAVQARHSMITLLYAARDEKRNNAAVVKQLLERHF